MREHLQLIAQAGACPTWNIRRYQQQAGHQGDDAQQGDGQKRFAPAEVLSDKRSQRYARNECDGQPTKHDRNS